MKRRNLAVRLVTLGVCCLVLSGALVACTPSSPRVVATATSTSAASAQPTTTPGQVSQQLIEQLAIAPTTALYPSPDGTLLAAEYGTTIKLYTVAGEEVSTPYTGAGVWGWLPDSSGIFLLGATRPLLIMDRQGQVASTRLEISAPELSQDRQWIGGTSSNGAEMAPRTGGPARVLASGGVFLGWQNNRAIYSTGGQGSALYALDPSGGSPVFLAQLTSDETPEAPSQESVNSPDGQILFLLLGKTHPMMLVGNQLRPAFLSPLFWVGSHDILTTASQSSSNPGDYVIRDLATGAELSDTGLSPSSLGGILAISGEWVVATTNNGSESPSYLPLILVNYRTKATFPLDLDSSATLQVLGIQVWQVALPVGDDGTFLSEETMTSSTSRPPQSRILLINAAAAG